MENSGDKIIFSLTDNGNAIATQLCELLPEAVHYHQPKPFIDIVQNAFSAGQTCIFVCATGIVMRALAPVLHNKRVDPPVIVIDDHGKFVIPLLSSHQGGGGALAQTIANDLNAQCVVTSATSYGLPVYVLGVGCDRGCPAEKFSDLLTRAENKLEIAHDYAAIASIDIKQSESGIHEFARILDISFKTFPASQLRTVEDQLSEKSEIVFREVGCYGVAEAAALIAATELTGMASELIISKIKNDRATLAIARSYLQ